MSVGGSMSVGADRQRVLAGPMCSRFVLLGWKTGREDTEGPAPGVRVTGKQELGPVSKFTELRVSLD